MALRQELNSQPIAQFGVPIKGTWNTAAIQTVPSDALYDSLNVFMFEGKLRNRPGLTLLTSNTFDGEVKGAAFAVTPEADAVLALTHRGLYELYTMPTGWVRRSDTGYANGAYAEELIDIDFVEAAEFVGLIARKGYALKQWTRAGGLTAITPTLGTVPFAKSVCVASKRAIALVPPHTIVWAAINNYKSWSPLATVKTSQTSDAGIAVRRLTNLAFVLYKERSLYTVRAQGNTEETAFFFNEPISVSGPAGVHAIVNVNGSHMYMTKNGRIALFDGTSYPKWVADGLWLFLRRDIDPVYRKNIFGVYDDRLHVVIFYYPRKADNGQLKGMVLINMPYEGLDVQPQGLQVASFKGVSSVAGTCGADLRFEDQGDRALIFTTAEFAKQCTVLDEEASVDVDTPYDCTMQTGMVAMPDGKHNQVTTETFVERDEGNGVLYLDPVLSDVLENKEGTIPDGKTEAIDLENNPVREVKPVGVPTRFVGLKYHWSSVSKIRYSGAIVHGRGVG